MHRHDGIPVLFAHVENHSVTENAGIVYYDAELAEIVDCALDDTLGRLEVSDALEIGHRLAASRANLLDDVFSGRSRLPCPVKVTAEIVDHDFASMFGHQERFFAADT